MRADEHAGNNDSLRKRYFFKLFSSLAGFLFGLVSQIVIPRGLGPEAYGSFSFLTNFFSQLLGFFDFGFSVCFYNNLSKDRLRPGLVSFYFSFTGIMSGLLVLFVAIAMAASLQAFIWPGQAGPYVYAALGLAILVGISQTLNQMTDAYGITVSAEILKLFPKFIGLLLLLGLFAAHYLDLKSFFGYNYFVWLSFSALVICLIRKKGLLPRNVLALSAARFRAYCGEFWAYSHPLFIASIAGLAAGILERWLLQIYGGSVQQGFYSLSYQIGAVCFLFTGAMAPLFTRELTIAHGNSDLGLMRRLFRRQVPLLYAITAYFSCFIAVEAEKVVYIFGGDRFSGAVSAVAVMAFYPMHQAYGQLSGAVFFATAQTKLYRNIGIAFTVLGLAATYLLIAPIGEMGLNAGAFGLALKMVIINAVGVNVQLFFNSRQLGFSYKRYLAHQLVVLAVFIGLAVGTDFSVGLIIEPKAKIASFLISGVIYSFIAIIAVWFFPALLGLQRQDIYSFFGDLGRRLTHK